MYKLKYVVRDILAPLFKKLSFIHPDVISYFAVIVALATGFLYYYSLVHPNFLIINVVLILIRMLLNTIDGLLAKIRGRKSLVGEVVNALPDRYSDVFLLIGLTLSGLFPIWMGILGICSVLLVSYTGMLGKALGLSWRHEGPLGKVERLVFLITFTLIQYFVLIYQSDFLLHISPMGWCMILFILFGQWTIVSRLKKMIRKIRVKEFTGGSIGKKVLVIYDSYTGNTKKVAEEIGKAVDGEVYIYKKAPDIKDYDFVFFGTPNIRAHPTTGLLNLLTSIEKEIPYALFVTYGVPIWGPLSARKCITPFVKKFKKSPKGFFSCKGFHAKFKLLKGHPDTEDLNSAYFFGIGMRKRIQKL